jgi:hypothetical protein
MIYSLHFLPEIENDLLAGYFWYEEKAIGLGEDFIRLFYAYTNEITRNPLVYQKVAENFRRRLLRRFPYAIYYRVEEEKVVIYGLFHCARKPVDIKNSLISRKGKLF